MHTVKIYSSYSFYYLIDSLVMRGSRVVLDYLILYLFLSYLLTQFLVPQDVPKTSHLSFDLVIDELSKQLIRFAQYVLLPAFA